MRFLAVVGLFVACGSSSTPPSFDTYPRVDSGRITDVSPFDARQDRSLDLSTDPTQDRPVDSLIDTPQDRLPESPLDIIQDMPPEIPRDTIQDTSFDLATDRPKFETLTVWPGGSEVTPAVSKKALGTNISGLVYQPALSSSKAILWAVQNDPSKVYRLIASGTIFIADTTEGWSKGKTLLYPDGKGSPDSEGMTRTHWDQQELYVVTERNNDQNDKSRMSILRYELIGSGTSLTATHEWNLTASLPSADPNQGLEAMTWIPDSYLVASGFFDENRNTIYDPTQYPNHGTGLFLVGMETSGMIHGFLLDHVASTFTRVTQFKSGQTNIMDLSFDRDTESLWTQCDDACENRMTVLGIDTDTDSTTKGRFIVRLQLSPLRSMTKINHEGLTLAPESECANHRKRIFWSDDDESDGIAIHYGTLPCGRLF